MVLDVRTPGEWEKKHIEGAHHIPLPTLPARLAELPKDQPVALMCGSGKFRWWATVLRASSDETMA